MKKDVILILLLFAGFSVFSQTEKGSFLVGANSNITFSSLSSQLNIEDWERDKINSTILEINPQIGYFLGNNFLVGFELALSSSTEKEKSDVFKSNTFAVGPILRYYIGRKFVKPFLQTSLAFGKDITEYNYESVHITDDKVKSNITIFDAGGGVSFFFTEKIALELGISYGLANYSFTTFQNQDAINKAKGIVSNIGMSITL